MIDLPFNAASLVEVLRWRAEHQPGKTAYVFLENEAVPEVRLTYAELDRRVRAIAAWLQRRVSPGDRVLLLYPAEHDFMLAYLGCFYAGVIAVPTVVPHPSRPSPRLQVMIADAGARAALTSPAIAEGIGRRATQMPELNSLEWLTIESAPAGAEAGWKEPALTGASLAFLQYTSGSTSAPKGVMVSHGNLMHNSRQLQESCGNQPDLPLVNWMPLFHDGGLIGVALQALYAGAPGVLMSPVAFLQNPYSWLQAITRYRGHATFGPNFAWELCVRKVTPVQLATLDLRSLRAAMCGAEPVRAETLEAFAKMFAPCGFRPEAFFPGYGLAEATLEVSGYKRDVRDPRPTIVTLRARALEKNTISDAAPGESATRRLVGCGLPSADQRVVIVDPSTGTPLADDAIGEIWVKGPSVAQGYWNRPDDATFRARLAGGDGPYLRTGDLGFMRAGELFIAGRSKDMIIVQGHNYYPQDIELTIEAAHPAVRPGCVAAFATTEGGTERLVIVAEVKREGRLTMDPTAVINGVRMAVAAEHGLRAAAVVLIQPASIPKTSSGKIQRHACHGLYLAQKLEILAEWHAPDAALRGAGSE